MSTGAIELLWSRLATALEGCLSKPQPAKRNEVDSIELAIARLKPPSSRPASRERTSGATPGATPWGAPRASPTLLPPSSPLADAGQRHGRSSPIPYGGYAKMIYLAHGEEALLRTDTEALTTDRYIKTEATAQLAQWGAQAAVSRVVNALREFEEAREEWIEAQAAHRITQESHRNAQELAQASHERRLLDRGGAAGPERGAEDGMCA